jgi:hypothetical protein
VRPRRRGKDYTLTLLQNRNNQFLTGFYRNNKKCRGGLKREEVNPSRLVMMIIIRSFDLPLCMRHPRIVDFQDMRVDKSVSAMFVVIVGMVKRRGDQGDHHRR